MQLHSLLSGWDIPTKGQIDVKLQVLVGYIRYIHDPDMGNYHMLLDMAGAYDYCLFVGKEYNGTIIQTYDISNGNVTYATIPTTPTPLETPTATPTLNPETVQNQPIAQIGVLFGSNWEMVVLTVMAVAIAVLAVMVVLWRRTGNLKNNSLA